MEGPAIPAALTILGLAFIEIRAAVPAGLALGLGPWHVWTLSIAGSVSGVAIVSFGGDRVRRWLTRGRRPWLAARTGRLYELWVRFGVPGWGLASPLLVAPAMGAAIGLILGAPLGRLLRWMVAGIVLWTSLLVLAGALVMGMLRR